ncbi:MAG: hypothetical protein R3F43_32025, partial [bacterium]
MIARKPALLVLAVTLFAGCGGEEGDQAPLSTVPADLQSIEGQAEDAYDQALAENSEGVAADAAAIDTAWQSFRAQAEADGAGADVLAAMDAAVSGLKAAAAAAGTPASLGRAANAVS